MWKMIYHLYISVIAVVVCCCVLGVLKFISISRMRLDNRNSRRKVQLSTLEILTLLRNLKPFPVGTYKGWKLHSYQHGCRVWTQRISPNNNEEDLTVYAAFCKVRVPAQVVLQILKDVSRTTAWKPGVLATSITSKPQNIETGSRGKGLMGGVPVQHDIITEETSLNLAEDLGTRLKQIVSTVIGQSNTVLSLTKEHNRYWHREDNGVCWMLQMSELSQEWFFFLAQPVEEVDQCLVTVLGYIGQEVFHNQSAIQTGAILGSFSEYILYRKVQTTPLIDIKLPAVKKDKKPRSYSSSDSPVSLQDKGKKALFRFQSLIDRPTFCAENPQSARRELVRSASILHHRTQTSMPNTQKSHSLDYRKPHDLNNLDLSWSQVSAAKDSKASDKGENSSVTAEQGETTSLQGAANSTDTFENNNVVKEAEVDRVSVSSGSVNSDDLVVEKDIDRILDEDVHFQENFDRLSQNSRQSETKEDVRSIVIANQTAAELLSVALQASTINLKTSQEDQVISSGGWMFCGLTSDVVILKKISLQDTLVSFLGKGMIQAPPKIVWDSIKNPRTRFAYDDSLKKVDVIETVTDSIKIVYYYHEVVQLFKKECCDMVVTQSEKVDGEKYVLAMTSADRNVAPVEGALRVKVLPSGWIIEPVTKDKKIFSMATYIMQIDLGNIRAGFDRTPFEDLISKQPMSIAYLRQYLCPGALWANKT